MEICIDIADRGKVTADTMAGFMADLRDQGYIGDSGLRYVDYDHWDPEKQDRVGETFDKPSIDEAIKIIADNGVEFLSIGLNATSHYRYEGRPEDTDHFTKIMYCLNIASGDVAEAMGEQIRTDYYFNPSFQSGRFHGEYGEREVCTLTLPGEGGYMPEDRWDECMQIIVMTMATECPEFGQLLDIMRDRFGEISLKFQYNELG